MLKRFALLLLALLLFCSGALAMTEPEFEPERVGFYNYCPSIIREDGVTHIYYCTNATPNYIRDSVGYRSSQDGETYSEETIVLSRAESPAIWDGVHTCDPDVIKGKFMLDGEEYNYLMAYLGCLTTNNQLNEIGLAVAKSPEGPFIKIPSNPIVHYEKMEEDWKLFQWGVGQPALVSLDKAGRVMLIYVYSPASGRWQGLRCEMWDLSDLNNPVRLGEVMDITNEGAIGRTGEPSRPANCDFVYDGQTGTLYMVSDARPYIIEGDVPGGPTFASAATWVMKYSQQLLPDEMDQFFADPTGQSWILMETIGIEQTGHPRNNNAGILSDPYGWLIEGAEELEVYLTISKVNEPTDSLFTYRIIRHTVPLSE